MAAVRYLDSLTEVLSHMKSVKYKYALYPTQQLVAEFPPTDMKVCLDWWDVMREIEKDLT